MRAAIAVAATLIALALPGVASAAEAFSPYPPRGFELKRHGIGPKRYALVKQLAKAYPSGRRRG